MIMYKMKRVKQELKKVGLRMLTLALWGAMPMAGHAQTGSENEPVSYIGGEICNPRLHDGGFRYAIGAENIQVLRANRTHPE